MEPEEIKQDVEKYAALDTVYASAGGKLLINTFIEEVVATIHQLAGSYKRISHTEMIAQCASLEARLDVIGAMANSPQNKEDAIAALKAALKS
jgi:HPt (histidine-containing phosphotransfer) domain-containing protein